MPALPASALLSVLLPVLSILSSCTPIMLEEERVGDRRVYVNDKAPNDSLARDLLDDGVKFVLQPGKAYLFSVLTDRTSDVLDVHSLHGSGRRSFKKINAIHDGSRQIFALTSTLSAANFFTARLLTGDQAGALSSIREVSLESSEGAYYDTLRVKLLFIRTLKNLPDAAAKNRFAAAFFEEMSLVLRPYGITVAGMVEVVEPASSSLVFPFSNLYVSLPGTREANHAHLYLVDSISVGNPGTGPVGEVLGFAPREVVDISDHRESRVILANRASMDIERLAVTAVHELGHFYGMRHTVSTRHDMLQDDDDSNVEDGFKDTPMCELDRFLAKTAEVPASAGDGPDAGRYCLRIAGSSCANTLCDLRNLMHPVECSTGQIRLSGEQVSFLKRNMALYRR